LWTVEGWSRFLSTTTAGLFQFQSDRPPKFFVTSGLIPWFPLTVTPMAFEVFSYEPD